MEKFAGISGREEGLPHLPDGQFLPPMEMNAGEKEIKESLERAYDDRMMTIGPCRRLRRGGNEARQPLTLNCAGPGPRFQTCSSSS